MRNYQQILDHLSRILTSLLAKATNGYIASFHFVYQQKKSPIWFGAEVTRLFHLGILKKSQPVDNHRDFSSLPK